MEYLTPEILIISIPLILATILFVFLYIKKTIAHKTLYEKYKTVIDIDKDVEEKRKKLNDLQSSFDELDDKYNQKTNELKTEYQTKRSVYEQLLKEISVLEEDLGFTTYGVYKPHYDFDTSEKYKIKLEEMRSKQKELIKDKLAIVCDTEWTVHGSKAEGKKMTDQYMRLMLRAFNSECDAAVLKVKWNNVSKMLERINRAYEAINKLGTSHNIDIKQEYLRLKLNELRLAHEYQEKLYEEKEEQRQIREQMREEQKVQKEIERAQKEAEDEEKRYEKALDRAKEELTKATGEELDKLNEQIASLQEELKAAHEKKERAIAQAQLTKAGHVYVLSNMGSFGDDVFKIGMTRRLDPIDRVKELSDASVPFPFDVHGMIYSVNAPELEKELHKIFDGKRLNMINNRKEFFRVSLDDIAKTVNEKHGQIELTKLAEAREYRETIALIEEKLNKKSIDEKVEEKFPSSL